MQRVKQLHDTGCFIACIATLLDITYAQAFERVHPGQPMPPPDDYWQQHKIWLPVEKALELMPSLGLEPIPARARNVSSLRHRTALILLRWRIRPARLHAVVFDGERKKFLDPIDYNSIRDYQNNLEAIFYVKRHRQDTTHLHSSHSNHSLAM